MRRTRPFSLAWFAVGAVLGWAGTDSRAADTPAGPAAKGAKQPNILVIWGDDIGTWNISHNNRGMMGYKTPNIDRIAKEGVGLHRLLRVSRAAQPAGQRSSVAAFRFAAV